MKVTIKNTTPTVLLKNLPAGHYYHYVNNPNRIQKKLSHGYFLPEQPGKILVISFHSHTVNWDSPDLEVVPIKIEEIVIDYK